jgi:hypothetical protein
MVAVLVAVEGRALVKARETHRDARADEVGETTGESASARDYSGSWSSAGMPLIIPRSPVRGIDRGEVEAVLEEVVDGRQDTLVDSSATGVQPAAAVSQSARRSSSRVVVANVRMLPIDGVHFCDDVIRLAAWTCRAPSTSSPCARGLRRTRQCAMACSPICGAASNSDPEPFRVWAGRRGPFGAVSGRYAVDHRRASSVAAQGFQRTCTPHSPSLLPGFESPPLRSTVRGLVAHPA